MFNDYKNIEMALKDGRKIFIELQFVKIDDGLSVVDFVVIEELDGKEKFILGCVSANTFHDALNIIDARLE